MGGYAEQLQLLGIVAFAMILGGLVGLEREAAQKPAGLRTHMLVAGAAALFVALGSLVARTFESPDANGDFRIQTDPVRVIEAVVTGVSFLGAGTIIRSTGRRIEGLTTAASLLIAAALGIAVASRQHIVAIGVTLMVLVVLKVVHRMEQRLRPGG
ncbi:MAG: MgtC/SapB family protein [Luteitalea sp.]|nr:MgtC/SapB family protein [Luteitalea sp.]